MDAALENLANAQVSVGGTPGAWQFEFGGLFSWQDMDPLRVTANVPADMPSGSFELGIKDQPDSVTVDYSSNSGTMAANIEAALEDAFLFGAGSVTVTLEAVTASYQNYRVDFTGGTLAGQNVIDIWTRSTNLNLAYAKPYNIVQGKAPVAEIQRITFDTDAQGDTFSLSFVHGGTTYTAIDISFDAMSDDLQSAVDAGFDSSDVSVAFWNGKELSLTFGGSLAGQDIPDVTVTASASVTDATLALDQEGFTNTILAASAYTVVVDYAAQPLSVLIGTGGDTFTLDLDGADGEYIMATGNADLDLFGVVTVSGAFVFEKKEAQSIVLSDGSLVDADLMTLGMVDVSAFVGYTSMGIQLDDISVAIAMWSEVVATGTPRTWTTVKASVGTAAFVGIDDLTLAVNTLAIEVNKENASDHTLVDYFNGEGENKATSLEVKVGPSQTVTFDIDDTKGDYAQLTGNVDLGVFDMFTVTGDFGVEKSSDQTAILSDGSSVTADLLTFGMSDVAAFVGFSGVGLQLLGVNLAVALWTEKSPGNRKWSSVKAAVGSADFIGIDELLINLNTISVEAKEVCKNKIPFLKWSGRIGRQKG